MPSPTGLVIRSAEDADWPAMVLLAATCFGSFRPREANDMWRTLMPADGVVIACDGADVVGMAYYLDLRLTVPGGTVLPMAGGVVGVRGADASQARRAAGDVR